MNPLLGHADDGHTTVTPYLRVKHTAQAIAFYQQAFGATEVLRFTQPNGTVVYAQIMIGTALIMLSDEIPHYALLSPQSLGGTTVSLNLIVTDVDAMFTQAVAAGATVQQPVEDQFYGLREGTLADPFGHTWIIGTYLERLSPQEMQQRFEAFMQS